MEYVLFKLAEKLESHFPMQLYSDYNADIQTR